MAVNSPTIITVDGQTYIVNSAVQGPVGPAGPTGATGATGATGPAPDVQVGTVTTLAPGDNATVSATEASGVVTFDYGIPQGATGTFQNGGTINQPVLVGETETQVSNTASSTAATLNQANGTVQALTLTADCTLTLDPTSGASSTAAAMTILLTQGASGGPYTVTWPSGTVFAAGSAPTLSTAAGETDVLVAVLLAGSSNWLIFVVAQGVTL